MMRACPLSLSRGSMSCTIECGGCMDPRNAGRFKFGGSVRDTLVRCNSRQSVKLDVQAMLKTSRTVLIKG